MNIPLELVDILKWRDTGPSDKKHTANNVNHEASVDHYMNVMHPVYDHMIQFGKDYHNFMDNNDLAGLHEFIDKYKNNSYRRLAKFVHGLQMDIDAVKNTLLYPDISNGMVEGINNIVKCIKRVCGGRAKIDLLTAKMVIRHKRKAPRTTGNTA
jgi:transposase